MASLESAPVELTFQALTPERWHALESLFGERGACGGCWCMWWVLKRSEFNQGKGQKNKKAFKNRVASGEIPGLIAFAGDTPVAWCALAPRKQYSTLERSRILKPVDEQAVWSVVCFFVARPFRGQGITKKLLRAAVKYAAENGARIVEGYPVEPRSGRMPDAFVYTGLPSMFKSAGFVEVLRRSPTRPIMRYFITPKDKSKRRTGRRAKESA
ncbi:MAG TPA: GNAT family N-acetyltransferase [Gemmataceae bacterium]|nr:GNAT family N-acetyltransferase [Gemmataceae bacterium]